MIDTHPQDVADSPALTPNGIRPDESPEHATSAASKWDEKLAALADIVGSDGVVADRSGTERVSRTNLPDGHIPDVAVYPRSTAEVQAVLRLANRFEWPVWPVSRGKNWGYGCKSAPYGGGITMILERMDQILEVNEELGYAVVEPGVSYKQLNDHLKSTGSRLWTDASGSTQYGSVLGNALDKGRGVTPYADHFGSLCGMEVVLPTGERIVTGGGGEKGYHAKHTYKWGIGPYWDGLFVQSNYGIVTQAGVWLMPAPECYDFFVFEYTAGPERFREFIDDFRELYFCGAMQAHVHLANAYAMLCIVSQYPREHLKGEPCLSEAALADWQREFGVSEWTFGCGLYGSRAEVKVRKKKLKKILGRYGGLRFLGGCADPGLKGWIMRTGARWVLRALGKSSALLEGLPAAIGLFRGEPTDYFARQAYFKSHARKPDGDIDAPRDGCGFLWTGPVVPFTSNHMEKALEAVKPLYREHGFEFFVELIVEGPRTMLVLFGVFYDKSCADETARALKLYKAIQETMGAMGYPAYRAGITSTRQALDSNRPLKELAGRIKKALDPRGILAPGKYGIEGNGR